MRTLRQGELFAAPSRALIVLLTVLTLSRSCFAQLAPFAFLASRQTQNTNPAPGYAYWWNPDVGTAYSGSALTSWTDQSANALVLRPYSATGPANTTTRNGHQLLGFSDTYPGNTLTNLTPSIVSSWEITAVVGTGSDILNPGQSFAIEMDSGTARGPQIYSGQWTVNWNGVTSGGSPAANTYYVVTCLFSASGTTTLWVNGVSVLTQSGASIAVGGIQIGGFGSGYLWSGSIGDVIIYTTPPSDANRQANEQMLRTKYGF